jgi:hypothetical protein
MARKASFGGHRVRKRSQKAGWAEAKMSALLQSLDGSEQQKQLGHLKSVILTPTAKELGLAFGRELTVIWGSHWQNSVTC